MVQNRSAQHTCRKTTADGVRSAVAGNNFSKKKTLKTIGIVLRPQSGKNTFDFCGGLMANIANLHCIRKNIGYVCADGFWSSAEILVNSLVLAKMQILQNARSVWLWAGVFAIHFWIDLEILLFPNVSKSESQKPEGLAILLSPPPCRIHVDLTSRPA